jgi:hypothetical protein
MFRSNSLPRLMAMALIAIAVTACSTYKDPAEEAVATIEEKMAGIHTQAEKYLPTQLAQVQAQVDELKVGIEQKEYQAVVATAPRVLKAVNGLIVDSALAKDSFNRKMQRDWADFATSMPDVFASVDKQIIRYTSRGRLPKGVSREAFKETVASFDAAKASWAEAAAAGNEGKYEQAVTQTNEVKQVVDTVMQTLGMSTG